ncbi:MAG TPA: flavodoxin family protein [Spirochaetia bacterium]|nr:flavodoxin family protein [Spirochaetia bacterium]
MNVLGISGSPRPDGNTAFAVRHALAVLAGSGHATRFISLAGKDIHPCIGCWQCSSDRACRYDDDMNEVLEAMRWCEGLIVGSPVYFGLVTGQLKTMMDRCVVLRPSYEAVMEMSGKVGGALACGGFRNGGQETTLQNIQTFLLQQNMRIINDGPGFSHSGATVVGEARGDELGLRTLENLAANMANALARRHED